MPGEPPDDQARIKALTEESKVLEEELIEVEAKNRLYTLLGERTRSAHTSLPACLQHCWCLITSAQAASGHAVNCIV